MAKYLISGSYSQAGVQGLLKEGGSSRVDAIGKLLADLGGSMEAFYFAFGSHDVFLIIDLPDDETAAALALTVAASGAVEIQTTPLLTPEQIDVASKKTVAYRAPGA